MIRTAEIAWLAGLLEGEGTFLMSGRSIAIAVLMTDRDVVERAAIILGGRSYRHPPQKTDRPRKPVRGAQVQGPLAAGWMMTIYAMLGQRRRGQVRQALTTWRQMRYVRLSPGVARSIVEAWNGGGATKKGLARRFGVSRETIYRVLGRSTDQSVREGCPSGVTPIDIAWLAGPVEGEGNISINGRSFTIRVKMGDRDVVEHAAVLLGGKLHPVEAPGPGRKRMWLIQIKGATAAGWGMTLYSWLGRRRRDQVRDALVHWRRQGNGAINSGLGDAILACRAERFSQSEIMALLKVSKSTVYRCTRRRLPRIRVTRQQQAARAALRTTAMPEMN